MIICPNCKTENEDDAKFCKNCGYYFLEEQNNNQNKSNNKDKKKKNKVKNKTKTKNKTKVKKEKVKAPKNKQYNDKPKSSVFTKVLLLFFILLSIGLLIIASILGYNYYLENNIEVPNVIGYNLKNKTKFILGKNLKKGRLPLTPIKIKI